MDRLLVDLGDSALAFALVASVYGMVMGVLAAQRRLEAMIDAAIRAVRITAALVALSCIGLWTAFLTDRFDIEYVFMYSSRDLPFAYKIAALWGGQKGSLMLWALILAVYMLFAAGWRRGSEPAMVAGVAAVLQGVMTFFLALANFSTHPFELLPGGAAPDGRGLNPLLQHPAMAIHPPTLYTGFVGMAVPFAFMASALWLGRRDDRWIRLSRKATLISWTALFAGNMLGMSWAYMELGWGGYWAWDPVENAACMPLLTGTAFLHSVMIQERRGMLKMWNAWLVAITFLLTIFGTFLTRSGVVSSVHSFGASTLGTYFLVFLTLATAFSVLTIARGRTLLRSDYQLDSLLSREAAFIVNNIILVGAAFSILWGTTYPILSEALTDVKATVGAPFFNRVNIPIAIALLLLTGIGPLIAWRRASAAQLRRSFLVPALGAAAAGIVLLVLGVRHAYALATFVLSLFVLATIAAEFARGVRARRAKSPESIPAALLALVARNPRRYGGYVVHVGILLFFVGIAASSAYQKEAEALLAVGQEMEVGPYRLRVDDVKEVDIGRAAGIVTTVTASRDGKVVGTLRPEKLTYYTGIRAEEQPTTNVGIRSTWRDDLYVVPAAWFPEQGHVHLKAYVNPMVTWIWTGGGFVILGVALALFPVRRPMPVLEADARPAAPEPLQTVPEAP